MISIKKIPVLRYGLIVLLVTVLFSGAIYLYIHYNSAQKLQGNIGKLISARENSELIDSCLLNLYNADNNSRLYAVTGDKRYIREFSVQINIAYNGQEAIELFETNHYDMVLTDIQMPVIGGLELLGLIRNNTNSVKAETPVIVLTAHVLKDDRNMYQQAGANDIVLKPFVERNLIEKISLLLKTRHTRTDELLFRYG